MFTRENIDAVYDEKLCGMFEGIVRACIVRGPVFQAPNGGKGAKAERIVVLDLSMPMPSAKCM